ncbi:flagellar assembly peptidoglycan hydrolase FlgJ [Pseudoduganella albidiflava]|uniref:Peptidoglycan hydrolase FlgJ n=1 Tax=Pseudoduganella albidiflava TaxID=321983 RepID=A0A411WUL2_9BURK|nr:flagellar assembly peptidoglycan hydrolase FlgJ [Pseudoduganella albidiflava]QBI00187.1 flagellar assembly peptidoglycan hydrolase FlgJ [Pseudoduganella albidiflava]GGY66501.1 flagellar rod assembly protein/muramidase FlgJ [Pseudoduganella albidiflava]
MIRQTSTPADLSSNLALDSKGLSELRQGAKAGSPEALKGAATQFEAMFVNMMLKSMRDATPQEGLLDNSQSKMFTTMLDQQTSQNIAKKGVGLADVLMRQLSKTAGLSGMENAGDSAIPEGGFTKSMLDAAKLQRSIDAAGGNKLDTASTSVAPSKSRHAHVRAFADKLAGHAEEASRATGIPAKFMLGQAALESGWGKREIKGANGASSHNLFGIKAGSDWKGKTVDVATTEYVNGRAQRKIERFRAYDSYADSFKDYARLITDNPRYEKVLASAGDAAAFARNLQKAGYATDPNYATKLAAVINKTLV